MLRCSVSAPNFTFCVLFLMVHCNWFPEILKMGSDKLFSCFSQRLLICLYLSCYQEARSSGALWSMVLWTSDALSTTQVDGFEPASMSVINFNGFGTMVVQVREGGWDKHWWSSCIWWSLSLGISRGSWDGVVNCASLCQVWLILQDSHSLHGDAWKFLKPGIFTGISLSKFSWLDSIDFSGAVPSPLLVGENHILSASLACGTFHWVYRWKKVAESFEQPQTAMLLGRLWGEENGRDLKGESLTGLGQKMEKSVAAFVGRWKI